MYAAELKLGVTIETSGDDASRAALADPLAFALVLVGVTAPEVTAPEVTATEFTATEFTATEFTATNAPDILDVCAARKRCRSARGNHHAHATTAR